MSSPWIRGLRSVALYVPDLALARDFYTRVWHLDEVPSSDANAIYLRGTGAHHHILSLHAAKACSLRDVTFEARNAESLAAIAEATASSSGRVVSPVGPIDEPGGGTGLTIADPDGRILRIVHGDQRQSDAADSVDKPSRLAHVVLNAHEIESTRKFFEQALGFTLADRTRGMAFLNCDRDHHSVALGDADNDALNHVAFMMPDLESVMRGGGRMRDAGYSIEWGPGRHGPGDNAFNYFVGPFDVVIEYTAGVEQIDDTYRVGGPEDWKWPEGRVDQWGISQMPSARLKEAQRRIFFAGPEQSPLTSTRRSA